MEDLEGDVAIELLVVGDVDGARRAAADLALQAPAAEVGAAVGQPGDRRRSDGRRGNRRQVAGEALGAAARLRVVEVDGEDLLELAARFGLIADALSGVGEKEVRAQRVIAHGRELLEEWPRDGVLELVAEDLGEAHGDGVIVGARGDEAAQDVDGGAIASGGEEALHRGPELAIADADAPLVAGIGDALQEVAQEGLFGRQLGVGLELGRPAAERVPEPSPQRHQATSSRCSPSSTTSPRISWIPDDACTPFR